MNALRSRPLVAGVGISNADRLVYPAEQLTKIDIARYYVTIADWIVPHVRGRPLTLVRCPEGLRGGCFFMKHSQVWAPPALRRVRIQEKTKVGEYLIADDVSAVVGLVQMGVLEIHTWNSVFDDLERPNRIVFDLDPGDEVAWRDVVAAAREVRRLLAALRLEGFVKTTGGRGLHIVVPLVPQANWPACLAFSRALAEAMARAQPDPLHGRLRPRRARTKDPHRLPAKQPHEHVGCRVLDASPRRRAGERADPVGGTARLARSRRVHRAHGAPAAQ